MFFEYAMVPWSVKLLCGLPAEEEAATIRWVYQDFGCSAESEIGQMIEGQLAITDRTLVLQGFGLETDPDLSDPFWADVCDTAGKLRLLPFQWKADLEDIPLPDEKQAALDAQVPHWTRLFELMEQGPQG